MPNQHTEGERHTVKVLMRFTPTQALRMERLAMEWHCSKADAMRIALDMLAAENHGRQQLVALLGEATAMLKGSASLGTDDAAVAALVKKIEAATRRESP